MAGPALYNRTLLADSKNKNFNVNNNFHEKTKFQSQLEKFQFFRMNQEKLSN